MVLKQLAFDKSPGPKLYTLPADKCTGANNAKKFTLLLENKNHVTYPVSSYSEFLEQYQIAKHLLTVRIKRLTTADCTTTRFSQPKLE